MAAKQQFPTVIDYLVISSAELRASHVNFTLFSTLFSPSLWDKPIDFLGGNVTPKISSFMSADERKEKN